MLARLGEYAFVAKINVSNLENSVSWYTSKLDMQEDSQFQTPTWRQMGFPNGAIPRVGIGLNQYYDTGTDTSVLTLVVTDITAARQQLVERDVDVSEIQDFGGVKLCYFRDPDCNRLGFRQNPSPQPKPSKIGSTGS